MSAPNERVLAYRGVMDRVRDLAAGLDDATSERRVPATPDWTVHDLVAHLAGVAVDSVAGNVAEAGSDPWTAAQVEARRGVPVADLLAEWEAAWPGLQEVLATIDPFRSGQVVFDAVSHEQDLRGALGEPGARDTDAMGIGWAWATGIVGQLRDGHGAGALALRTEDGEQVVGAGDVTGAVAGSRFDLFRAMTGRRSKAQVKAFAWDGKPAIGHLCFLPLREDDLVE